jgi:hypothetical protein
MDNDTLINQARTLYSLLQVQQYAQTIKNKTQFDKLDYLVMCAYCRYQRRLNRCVLCYQDRSNDCVRETSENKRRFCPRAYHPSDSA